MIKAEPPPQGQSTLIHDAIRDKCEADIRKAILQRPDAINKADGLGNTPLHLAVMFRDLRVLKILLDYGANVNQPNSQTCETSLHVSCGLQLYEISEILLNRGADPNRRDYRRRTALHHSPPLARFVRLLASHGADVNARDTSLTSPLQLAMEYGSRFWRVDFASRRAFVKEMVRANADLELQNKCTCTPTLLYGNVKQMAG
jgi:ankyrin repeat protein